jgi:hypothetical protein
MNATIEELFEDVAVAMESAKLVAFDGCHKIYLAMDDEQAEWFKKNYNGADCTDRNFTSSPEEMLKMVREWWDESCGLRFINAVETNEEDPNAGFTTLIPQGAGEEEVEEDEEEDEE